MRMLRLLALTLLAAPAMAETEPEAACMIAANRVLDFILADLPDNDAGRAVTSTLERDGRQATVTNLANSFTIDQCSFLMTAPDSTVQAVAKTITAD